MRKNIKIIFAGGGTGGSVTPLLAVAEELNSEFGMQNAEFLWLGTKTGVEQGMVKRLQIRFRAIAGGKLRRYWSWRNFSDLFLIAGGFFQSLGIIYKSHPDLVMCAGGFVGVPVVWAAWVLRVPVLIHQQDVRPGLANKLMAPYARVITVTFEQSLKDYGKKAVWTGNPVRKEIRNAEFEIRGIKEKFKLNDRIPVVLILGGGTGAMAINNLVKESISELTKFCQIIHLTGKSKQPNYGLRIPNYEYFEFFDSETMAQAYRAADAVVSRCGMNVLTELAYLGKPAILIPIPDSHQEENAAVFARAQAAVILDQKELAAEQLADGIKRVLNDTVLSSMLSSNIRALMKPDANRGMINVINGIIQSY